MRLYSLAFPVPADDPAQQALPPWAGAGCRVDLLKAWDE